MSIIASAGTERGRIVAGLERGELNPVIGKEFPLAQAASAHHAVSANHAYRKIVLCL